MSAQNSSSCSIGESGGRAVRVAIVSGAVGVVFGEDAFGGIARDIDDAFASVFGEVFVDQRRAVVAQSGDHGEFGGVIELRLRDVDLSWQQVQCSAGAGSFPSGAKAPASGGGLWHG